MVTTPAERITATPVRWPDDVHGIITGDLTAAAAYCTPGGGAVMATVAPCGLEARAEGLLGFTTSLGFPRKLDRIIRDPRVAMAFHARQHGFATSSRHVLVQGIARVDLTPSRARIESFLPQAERYLGPARHGAVWDRLLAEYYYERVFIDVSVVRIMAWGTLDASGDAEVFGAAAPRVAAPQTAPKLGTEARVPVARLVRQVHRLPHRLVAYRGDDGFPVVVPVRVAGYGPEGLRLVAAPGLLPPGGRRAGFLAHGYRPRLIGLGTRTCTGWLSVEDGEHAVYAPHTSHGFTAPPMKSLLLVVNGVMAKAGMRHARRTGLVEELQRLQRLAG